MAGITAEVAEDLVWRVDDTAEVLERFPSLSASLQVLLRLSSGAYTPLSTCPQVLERRLAEHRTAEAQVQRAFEDASVPWFSADNARSELGTFADVAQCLQGVAMQKLDVMVAELLSKGVTSDDEATDDEYTSMVDLALDVDRSAAYAALQKPSVQVLLPLSLIHI